MYMHASPRSLLGSKASCWRCVLYTVPFNRKNGLCIWEGYMEWEDFEKGHKAFYIRVPCATILKCGVSDKTCSGMWSMRFSWWGKRQQEGICWTQRRRMHFLPQRDFCRLWDNGYIRLPGAPCSLIFFHKYEFDWIKPMMEVTCAFDFKGNVRNHTQVAGDLI